MDAITQQSDQSDHQGQHAVVQPATPLAVTILAFDFGAKRIGVALSPAHSQHAEPLTTLDGEGEVWSQVRHLIDKHQPDLLVVGWPRGLDGQHTAQTGLAEAFARTLEEKSTKRVVLQDEVLTSEEAQRRVDPKLPLRKQGEVLDAIAAQIILEDYIREPH